MQMRKESLTKTKNSGLPRGIQTLTSAIPVQCSNQYVLYCYWTVFNISRILCILTLPPYIYSVRIQNTFSKIQVVYIKRYAYQSDL